MKKIFTLLFMHVALYAGAQNDLTNQQSAIALLKMDKGTKEGSGFIVGAINDTLFIVTARHVVMSGNTICRNIEVSINNSALSSARVLHLAEGTDTLNDIALVTTYLKGYSNGGYAKMVNPAIGLTVRFFRAKEAIWLPDSDWGTIETWENKNRLLYSIYLPEIELGDSGNAIFSREGILGMVVREKGYYAEVLSINHIRDIIVKWDSKYWMLGSN